MTKEEILAKFNRISNDPRQAQEFVGTMADEIEALKEKPAGTKLYMHRFPTQHVEALISTSNKIYSQLSTGIEKQEYFNSFINGGTTCSSDSIKYLSFTPGPNFLKYITYKLSDGTTEEVDLTSANDEIVSEL